MAEAPDKEQQESEFSAELVRRIDDGDAGAEAQMYERYEKGLIWLLQRKSGDGELARDVCHDTFRVALEKLREEPLDDPTVLRAYLRGIALKRLSAEFRKRTRRNTRSDTEAVEIAPDDQPGPLGEVTREDVGATVRRLLMELSDKDRDILTRLYLGDEDRETVARDHNLDAQGLNRELSRAKKRFKNIVLRAESGHGLRLVGK